MDIRRICIRRFGCWDHLEVHIPPVPMMVLHLADGGRSEDFLQFLRGMLLDFPTHVREVDGELDVEDANDQISIKRQISKGDRRLEFAVNGRSSSQAELCLDRLRSHLDPQITHYLWSGSESAFADEFRWLEQNPSVSQWLLSDARAAAQSTLHALSQIDVQAHVPIVQQLVEERESLLRQLAEQRPMPAPAVPQVASKPSQAMVNAELRDTLRQTQRQHDTMALAAELAEPWGEAQRLSESEAPSLDLKQHQNWLREFRDLSQELEKQERRLRKSRLRTRAKPSTSKSHEFEIRKLLNRRQWVIDAVRQQSATKPPLQNIDTTLEGEVLAAYDEMKKAAEAWEKATRRLAEAEPVELATPTNGSEQFTSESEFGRDDPIANESTDRQLAELKRRRLWVREERMCLLRRRQTIGTVTIATGILLCLSLASLFGVLLVNAPTYEWLLTCLGLGGMVAAGTIRLTYEQRLNRRLHRSALRLARMDEEIARLTVPPAAPTPSPQLPRRAKQSALESSTLRSDVDTEEERRRQAASDLRKAQLRADIPHDATRAEARQLFRERRQPKGGTADSQTRENAAKLKRWSKQARRAIARADDCQLPSEDPIELLAQLETTFQDLRDRAHAQQSAAASPKQILRRIRSIEARQSEILQLSDCPDEAELVARQKQAEDIPEQQRRLRHLRQELQLRLDCHEDGEDVREILGQSSPDAIHRRLQQLKRQLQSLGEELSSAERASSPPLPPKPESTINHRAERTKLEIRAVEARIRRAVQAAQERIVLQRAAGRLLAEIPRQHMSTLRRLTTWDGAEITSGGLELFNEHQRMLATDFPEKHLVWLALRLRATERLAKQGNVFPLLLTDDDLGAPQLERKVVQVLQEAAEHGQQILVLTSKSSCADALHNIGIDRVRIGLQERPAPQATTIDRAAG